MKFVLHQTKSPMGPNAAGFPLTSLTTSTSYIGAVLQKTNKTEKGATRSAHWEKELMSTLFLFLPQCSKGYYHVYQYRNPPLANYSIFIRSLIVLNLGYQIPTVTYQWGRCNSSGVLSSSACIQCHPSCLTFLSALLPMTKRWSSKSCALLLDCWPDCLSQFQVVVLGGAPWSWNF